MLNGLINYIPAIKYGNLVDNAELNPAISQSATVAITSAQLLALATTPITLITTTASGTAIILDSMVFEMNPTSTTYTVAGAENIVIQYNNSTTTGSIMSAVIPQSVITSGSAGYYYLTATNVAGGLVVVPNTGITLGVTGNLNPTVGTGTAKVILNYYIVTL
jgi:hypothetical protein